MENLRYTQRSFPPYLFIPGQNPHPNKEGGYRYGQGEPELKAIVEWSKDEDYLYSLDLYNHGYFWEAHVWWEAYWNTYGRTSGEAMFFQAMIKLAAGHLKGLMGKKGGRKGHYQRAVELFESAIRKLGSSEVFGVDVQELVSSIKAQDEETDLFCRVRPKFS